MGRGRSDSEVFLLKMSGCIVFYFSYIPAWIIVFQKMRFLHRSNVVCIPMSTLLEI